jgi:hypothetical protein
MMFDGIGWRPPAPGRACSLTDQSQHGPFTYLMVLLHVGPNRLGVMKAIREYHPEVELTVAKQLVDRTPQPLFSVIGHEAMEQVRRRFERSVPLWTGRTIHPRSPADPTSKSAIPNTRRPSLKLERPAGELPDHPAVGRRHAHVRPTAITVERPDRSSRST